MNHCSSLSILGVCLVGKTHQEEERFGVLIGLMSLFMALFFFFLSSLGGGWDDFSYAFPPVSRTINTLRWCSGISYVYSDLYVTRNTTIGGMLFDRAEYCPGPNQEGVRCVRACRAE